MKKKIIFIMIFVSAMFLNIGISNVNALIMTEFGTYPDLPVNSEYYMIVKNRSDDTKQYLYLGNAGNNCVYSDFYTNIDNRMSVGIHNSSGTSCSYSLFLLNNNNWQWVRDVNAGYVNSAVSGSYSDYYFANTIPFKLRNGTTYKNPGGFVDLFNVYGENGEVLVSGENASANLYTWYLDLNLDDYDLNNYKYYYFDKLTQQTIELSLKYWENGEVHNNHTYYYYVQTLLYYNTDITLIIKDFSDNVVFQQVYNAYLPNLISLTGYTMYDFRNYEFANMSYINTGSFGLSSQLNTNITINAINYNTNTKIDFLTSSYFVTSHTDSGITWYEFNFNSEPIYLEFINNFNDTTDFYTYIDTYNLYLYFDNNAYVHLSGSPNSVDNQDNSVNQQAYKDSQGNVQYKNNPIVINADNSSEFFQNLQRYFKDFDNDTFGLTGIITSPLNLIQNLLTNTCNELVIPLPYVNSNLVLPCMSTIYSQYFNGFYVIYQDITFGIIAYWVIVRIFNMVKDFRNPDHDEIEVLDL